MVLFDSLVKFVPHSMFLAIFCVLSFPAIEDTLKSLNNLDLVLRDEDSINKEREWFDLELIARAITYLYMFSNAQQRFFQLARLGEERCSAQSIKGAVGSISDCEESAYNHQNCLE